MIKEFIFSLVYPFANAYAMLRYKNIWGLKQRLMQKPSRLLRLVYGHYFMRRGSFVGLTCRMAGTPCFPHGVQGIFISNDAVLGKDVTIFQQVTIGSNTLADSRGKGSPQIGDNVYIGAGAKIIGGVRIGNNCRIGANAVVYTDMPDNAVAVCAPTRILERESLDNTYITYLDGKPYHFRDGKLREGLPSQHVQQQLLQWREEQTIK